MTRAHENTRTESRETPSSTANLIGRRVRYALSLRGFSQQTAIPRVNEHLRALAPTATLLNDASFSRILTQKRPVKDYEVVAISRVLDVTVSWLLASGDITQPKSETA